MTDDVIKHCILKKYNTNQIHPLRHSFSYKCTSLLLVLDFMEIMKKTPAQDVPVTYEAVDECVAAVWIENPDLVIHVGMDVNVTVPTLETQSYNFGYNKPDTVGIYCPNDGCVSCHGEPVLYCKMDLNKVYGNLIDNHVACSTSNNPGQFLCGYIYYKSLELSPDRVVFVHVPCSKKMPIEDIAKSLLQIIRELAAQKGTVIPQK
ncbi:unnamed protein product [Heterobilharzia americana]|nr:unnamed protein product [Heterobilharzia americana]